jgi:predicted anti-sigma-YlaC factor YlaD
METNCFDVRYNLEDYREDRLDRVEKTAVERHLHYCEDCIHQWTILRVRREEEPCRV